MPAVLDGAMGMLQGVWCRVWAANLYLRARTTLDLKPMAQVACNDFNKKMGDTNRVCQPGFAVYIALNFSSLCNFIHTK